MSMRALVLLCCSFWTSVLAYNNGYGLKPFLGWQSWCAVGKCGTDLCTDKQIRTTAQALVSSGLKKAGFEWVSRTVDVPDCTDHTLYCIT